MLRNLEQTGTLMPVKSCEYVAMLKLIKTYSSSKKITSQMTKDSSSHRLVLSLGEWTGNQHGPSGDCRLMLESFKD